MTHPRVLFAAAALACFASLGAARADEIKNPIAVFGGLDKITGRVIRFTAKIDETVQFGALQIRPRACYTKPPTETPQTVGFLQVDQVTPKGALQRIFSGWMFAASPGLNGIEHPVYDVWLLNCLGGHERIPDVAETPPDEGAAATPAPAAAPLAAPAAAAQPIQPAPKPGRPGAVPAFNGPPIEIGSEPGATSGSAPGASQIAPPGPLSPELSPPDSNNPPADDDDSQP